MRPHSTEWYKRLSTRQAGYFYPWRSQVAAGNGEEAYLALVQQHLGPAIDLLDVACGHGALALQFAPSCHSVFGYDVIDSYITMAQEAARAQNIRNARFACYDSSLPANQGQARIPADDASFDLLICRKGPFHWVEDARRVARPGATLIMLIPDTVPMPSWHDQLPSSLQWSVGSDPTWARTAIEPRLAKSGLQIHSWWSFDVPEYFTEPQELYAWRTFGRAPEEVPPYTEVAPALAQLVAEHRSAEGLAIRHRRHLWKAVVPG
ncbi:MAG: class I SAM-dependent methyltransferase [Caldilineaceae bacterium]|nr:class I SAM-dependent methyltransferase [Caldilineaceae bacterium]